MKSVLTVNPTKVMIGVGLWNAARSSKKLQFVFLLIKTATVVVLLAILGIACRTRYNIPSSILEEVHRFQCSQKMVCDEEK